MGQKTGTIRVGTEKYSICVKRGTWRNLKEQKNQCCVLFCNISCNVFYRLVNQVHKLWAQ